MVGERRGEAQFELVEVVFALTNALQDIYGQEIIVSQAVLFPVVVAEGYRHIRVVGERGLVDGIDAGDIRVVFRLY